MNRNKGFSGVNVVTGKQGATTRPLEDRFWEKIDCSGGEEACWPWLASKRRGYGQFAHQGKIRMAHLVAWELANGRKMHEGLESCHTCHNRACCNPKHIREGTRSSNQQDNLRDGRHVTPHGTEHPFHKMSDEKVQELRKLYEAGWGPNALGAKFGIANTTAKRIAERKTWKHVA